MQNLIFLFLFFLAAVHSGPHGYTSDSSVYGIPFGLDGQPLAYGRAAAGKRGKCIEKVMRI